MTGPKKTNLNSLESGFEHLKIGPNNVEQIFCQKKKKLTPGGCVFQKSIIRMKIVIMVVIKIFELKISRRRLCSAPLSYWCCCFLFHLFGGVVVVLLSLRSFWVVLFSLPSLGVVRFVRLPCGWWSLLLQNDNFNGANKLNQVFAVQQSEAHESKVVLLWVVVFSVLLRLGGGVSPLPPSSPSLLLLLSNGGVFLLLLLQGSGCFSSSSDKVAVFPTPLPRLGGVFPPPLFGWPCFPSFRVMIGVVLPLTFVFFDKKKHNNVNK